jgi:hypothetical protein
MFQHDIRRLKNGNITIFDGGDAERRKYSRAVEYEIDEENKTATKVWEYRKSPDIYSPNMGSVQRLDNGNTLICWGLASMTPDIPLFTEVDPEGNIVAELTFDKPLTTSYRAMKFEWEGSNEPAADVTAYEVLVGNTYEFESGDQETGISMKITQHNGFGYNEIIVKRYPYGPASPSFVTKAPILEKARIVIDQFAIDQESFQANLMFDVDFYEIVNPDSAVIMYRETEGSGLFVARPTQFNKATNKIVATMNKFGEYVIAYPDNVRGVYEPIQVFPVDGEKVDQSKKVTLEWTPMGYVNSYSLEVATDAGFSNKVVDEQSLTSAVYELASVDANTEYFWRVSAKNIAGESGWAESSFNASVPYIRLIKPFEGKPWTIGLEWFITWEDNLEEEVILELYEDGAYLMTIDTVASSGGYKWDIPLHLEVGENYTIYARSLEDPDINDTSNTFALVDYQVSIPMVEQMASFLGIGYTSPDNIRISYTLKEAGHVNLKLFNAQGKVVSTLVNGEQPASRHAVDVGGRALPAGIYICTLQVGNAPAIYGKMIIVK